MKRVLIIGPDFTPSSLPPALRIRGFVNHLADFGWAPTVLTVDPKLYDWPIDFENLELLAPGCQVIETNALSAGILRKIGAGDIALRSLWQLSKRAIEICRTQHFDLVFISMPPNYQVLIGRLLHALYGLPYVIDYIDPWTSIDYWSLPKEQRSFKRNISYCLARVIEPLALKRASHLVGVSKGTTDHVQRTYVESSKLGAAEIPYGGDEQAFKYLRNHARQNSIFDKQDGLFHLSYVGACSPGMRSTVRGLFAAVRQGLERSPELFGRLRLHFVGTTYATNSPETSQVISLARELNIPELVDEHATRVSYLDALQLLLDSNALLVIGSNAPHYTASKIFPYILARKPLVVIFHESSTVVSILRETGAAKPITFNSDRPPTERIEDISSLLEETLQLPTSYSPPTRWQSFEAYTSKAMTAKLAEVFENCLATNSAINQSLNVPATQTKQIVG